MKQAVKLTAGQAAEVAIQGIFAKADRARAERFRSQGKLDAAKKADDRANARIRSLRERHSR